MARSYNALRAGLVAATAQRTKRAALLLPPALAALLAWVILGEPLGAVQAAGGAIVLIGIATARRTSDT